MSWVQCGQHIISLSFISLSSLDYTSQWVEHVDNHENKACPHHSRWTWVIASRSCTRPQVHSFTFTSQLFLRLLQHRLSYKVPQRSLELSVVLGHMTKPNQTSLCHLTVVSRVPGVVTIFCTKSLVFCSLYDIHSSLLRHLLECLDSLHPVSRVHVSHP